MTARARPVKRSTRSVWGGPDRRNLYITLGFGLVVLAAILILVGAAAATWYGDHLAPVAHVNGQAITKDDLVKRAKIDLVRLGLAIDRINTEHSAGRLSDTDWQQQEQYINQAVNQVDSTALEQLIDERVEGQLASQQGVSVTADQIEAKLTEEATNPEQRHAWVIDVEPKRDQGASQPTEQQKADAKKAADQALADLNAGKDWVEVSKAISTSGSASTGGDTGWVTNDNTSLDAAMRDALFKLQKDGHTDVILAANGTYQIGRVTDIVPQSVNDTYRQQIIDKGVSIDDYKQVVRTDLIQKGLQDKILAQALAAGPQRHVLEIYIKASTDPNTGDPVTPSADAVKVRHILYAPNDKPDEAKNVKADDPAWKKAEDEANAAYLKLKADPSLFPQMARDDSDDSSTAVNGGGLGWEERDAALVPEFLNAIFAPGVQPGQVLAPIKTQFGWHVIQVVARGGDANEAADLEKQIAAGTDFSKLAKEYSDGAEAKDGGDVGWIARYEKKVAIETPIFSAAVGSVTQPVTIEGDGIHIFKVLAEETRTPGGDQVQTLKDDAFNNWYEAQKKTFDIKRDAADSSSL